MNLYDLTTEYRAAAAMLADLECDETTLADTLEGLRFPVEQKARNVALVIGNIEAHAKAAAEASKALAAKAKAADDRAEWLRAYLLANMQASGISKIEPTADLPYFKIALQNNPASVLVHDAAAIPADYMRQPEPPPPAPDKKLILQALKDGYSVPGCELRQTQRVVIK